uniref:sortilin-related receptor-like isoform X1 n=1 Tax=Ciona intestinalis TaxID=7719 RepID=UPI00089DD168|nr:sortilin-related receptor-like isoform X1 [Ciona intestinalis]|eukprot:XP_018670591.1 sortilin-related receptor-like isoform X1 [Ciona intestinalis]
MFHVSAIVCIFLLCSNNVRGQELVNSQEGESRMDDYEYTLECLADEKACADGENCVRKVKVCDGAFDCPDNSDESNCTAGTTQAPTTTTTEDYSYYQSCTGADEFDCGENICILRSKLCDGNFDCPDSNDEDGCPTTTAPNTTTAATTAQSTTTEADYGGCGEDEFECGTGVCIEVGIRCDGRDDCGDFSDEENCPTPTTTTASLTSTTFAEYDTCDADQFECLSDGVCIQLSSKCDGRSDCSDNSDENNCQAAATTTTASLTSTTFAEYDTCDADQFECLSDGVCIQLSSKCDGRSDCSDNSDENNCQAAAPTTTDSTTAEVTTPTTPSTSMETSFTPRPTTASTPTCVFEGTVYPAGSTIKANNCTEVTCSNTGKLLTWNNPDPAACHASVVTPTMGTLPPSCGSQNLANWTSTYTAWRNTMYGTWLPMLKRYVGVMGVGDVTWDCTSLGEVTCSLQSCVKDLFDCDFCYCQVSTTDGSQALMQMWKRDNDFWAQGIQPVWNDVFNRYVMMTS